MEKSRGVYGVLLGLTILAYSIPWYSAGEETFVGWEFTLPFTISYVIGIALGLIVLFTKKASFVLTIVAGVLMVIAVAIATVTGEAMGLLGELAGEEVTTEAGMAFAWLMSLAYLIGGSILCRKW